MENIHYSMRCQIQQRFCSVRRLDCHLPHLNFSVVMCCRNGVKSIWDLRDARLPIMRYMVQSPRYALATRYACNKVISVGNCWILKVMSSGAWPKNSRLRWIRFVWQPVLRQFTCDVAKMKVMHFRHPNAATVGNSSCRNWCSRRAEKTPLRGYKKTKVGQLRITVRSNR